MSTSNASAVPYHLPLEDIGDHPDGFYTNTSVNLSDDENSRAPLRPIPKDSELDFSIPLPHPATEAVEVPSANKDKSLWERINEASVKNVMCDVGQTGCPLLSFLAASFPQSMRDMSIVDDQIPPADTSGSRNPQTKVDGINKSVGESVIGHYIAEVSVDTALKEVRNSAFIQTTRIHHHIQQPLRGLLLQEAQVMDSRLRYPNKQKFRRKLVLLGHQEVGKTSLRKCFASEGYFFNDLPDVRTTTGVEVHRQCIRVGKDEVELILSDFAGQESYHSHSLFLTDRSIFLLVWKISAVEQDFQSSGISVSEEDRMYKWIAEVYAKFPRAKIALVATHLDELRVQGQRSVEWTLSKVEGKITGFMQRIATVDPESGKCITNEIVGNFAVSCKNRRIISAGKLRHMSGQKLSALLRFFAGVAHRDCMEEIEYPAAAIPGRHIRLMEKVEETKRWLPKRMLMPLGELVHTAVQYGVESDTELLQIARLMHSWDVIYLFDSYRLAENLSILLHPLWLGRLAAALFSYAHVLRTPLHLRSIIGGLEYTVSQAEAADMHLMRKGFLRWPLVRVLFRRPLCDVLGRDPDDPDYMLVLQLLSSLDLLFQVEIPCDELSILEEETPIDPQSGNPIVRIPNVTRYFIPSLSPYGVPESLKRLAPLFFTRGANVKFEFNLLPNEVWWRLQARLQKYQHVIILHEPHGGFSKDGDDDMLDEYRLLEADEEHNRWNDAMWLRDDHCRVFLYREGLYMIRIFFIETKPRGAEGVLQVVEKVMTDLLGEYQGLQRAVRLACPELGCSGWLMASEVAQASLATCYACKKMIGVAEMNMSGAKPRGFTGLSDWLLKEAEEVLRLSLSNQRYVQACEYLGIPLRVPQGDRSNDGNTKTDCTDSEDDVNESTVKHVDFTYALDRIVRVIMVRSARDRVGEEAHRRRMQGWVPTTPWLSY